MKPYNIILQSCGSCSRYMAADILSDTFHYTRQKIIDLISDTPSVLAYTDQPADAQLLADMLDECGLEVSLQDETGTHRLPYTKRSVFQSDGSLIIPLQDLLDSIAPCRENGYEETGYSGSGIFLCHQVQ